MCVSVVGGCLDLGPVRKRPQILGAFVQEAEVAAAGVEWKAPSSVLGDLSAGNFGPLSCQAEQVRKAQLQALRESGGAGIQR